MGRGLLEAVSKGLFKRHTTATIAATTYAQGEPVWDTDLNLLRVGDGSTAGGILVDSLPDTYDAGIIGITEASVGKDTIGDKFNSTWGKLDGGTV